VTKIKRAFAWCVLNVKEAFSAAFMLAIFFAGLWYVGYGLVTDTWETVKSVAGAIVVAFLIIVFALAMGESQIRAERVFAKLKGWAKEVLEDGKDDATDAQGD
jgi:uncharacterized membrane protein